MISFEFHQKVSVHLSSIKLKACFIFITSTPYLSWQIVSIPWRWKFLAGAISTSELQDVETMWASSMHLHDKQAVTRVDKGVDINIIYIKWLMKFMYISKTDIITVSHNTSWYNSTDVANRKCTFFSQNVMVHGKAHELLILIWIMFFFKQFS